MSNQLSLAGAQPAKQTRYAPLWNETFSTGLVTQRNPLRSASGNALTNKMYGSKNDGLLDGLNIEISNRLTFVRRPGLSVYNSQTFPPIDNFYEFQTFNANTNSIRVMADTASVVYDATGPATKTAVFNKSTGAGKGYFQSVGNTLYYGDGIDQFQWIQSATSWTAATNYPAGTTLVDPNGNIQVAVGSFTITAINVRVGSTDCVLSFNPSDPGLPNNFLFLTNVNLSLSAFTNATFLNGLTRPVIRINDLDYLTSTPNVQVNIPAGHSGYSSFDSGLATSGNGISGGAQPTWATGLGAVTQDGGAQWINKGSATARWGIAAPVNAPLVSQQPITPPYSIGSWQAALYYSSTGQGSPENVVILDGSSNVQRIRSSVGEPQTGASIPAFSGTVGGTTLDGTITWVCLGPSGWLSSHAYSIGDVVVASVGAGNYFFRCTKAGTSGTSAPIWIANLGFNVTDNSVQWVNVGISAIWSDIGATTFVSGLNGVLDSNGNIENIQISGLSGGTEPTWATTQGLTTVDNTATWINAGPLAAASTGAWYYAYSYKNSVTGAVSTASPVSAPVTQLVNNEEIIQGDRSTDPQVDTIVIYRSVQGGSPATLLELAEIPNPASGNWTYIDTTPDTSLNDLILAPIAFGNNPPPTGLVKMTYHLGRIWGVVNNTVYFSGGPDITNGNGDQAFPPANVFVFPDQVNRLYATTQGLFVFTVSDIYLISGTTTATFYSVPYMVNIGLQNYNAFDVNGAIVYMFTSDFQVVSLDLSSGANEVGFPIGDQFQKVNWAPSTAQVSWHTSSSQDKGLYVCDGSTGWFRLYPTPSPEVGLTWAPFAGLVGGCSIVQSIETSPGVHNLLVGPKTSGPILKRDRNVFTDNGSSYDANFLLGSIVLAQPSQIAELVFLTTDSIVIGTPPTIEVQLDEIAPYSAGMFEPLTNFVADPPQLAPSTSIWGRRYYFNQTTEPALCRHLQIRFDWGTDTVQNELLSLTLMGGFAQELS